MVEKADLLAQATPNGSSQPARKNPKVVFSGMFPNAHRAALQKVQKLIQDAATSAKSYA
jgi:hypothetical protein